MVANQLVVLILKLIPFLFSIILKFISGSFSKKFDEAWGNYEERLDYEVDEDDEEKWRYQLVALYMYDKTLFSSSLGYAGLMSAVLHLILVYQSGTVLLVLPAIGYIGLGYFADNIADKFFIIEREGRNPNTYEDYYYGREGKAPDILESRFKGFLPSTVDERLSPVLVSVIVDIVALINIGTLEAVLRIGVLSSNPYLTLLISLICIFSILMVLVLQFPFSL